MKRILAAAFAFACSCALPGLCAAQSEPTQLDPVTVTAERKPEDAQDVPISLTVIDGQKIRDGLVRGTEDLADYAANVHLTLSFGVEASIRGIGSHDIPSAESPVGIFRDGVYLGHGTFTMAPLLDFEQVEVVRGAQGTLLGKNTPAGALLYTTRDPADHAEISGHVTGGNLQRRSVDAAGSLPLGDDWGLRVAAAGDESDGFLYDTTLNEKQRAPTASGARAKLVWHPDSAWRGWLSIDKGHRDEFGDASQISHATQQMRDTETQYDPRFEDRLDLQNELNTAHTGVSASSNITSSQVAYLTSLGEVAWIGNVARSNGWFLIDGDDGPAPLVDAARNEGYRQFSHELRLQGAAGPVEYIAGAYYLRNAMASLVHFVVLPQGNSALDAPPPGAPPALTTLAADTRGETVGTFRQHSMAISPFTQVAWHVTDALTATAGLRYTREDKFVYMKNHLSASGTAMMVLLNEEEFEDTREKHESDVSPRVFLQYALTDRVNLYGGWLRGFKGGGFDDLSSRKDTLAFDAERSSGYEAGIKSLFPGTALALDLNLFDTDYRNLQVYDFEGNLLKVVNAPRSRIRGAELDGRWLIGGGFGATLSLGYLHARYVEFPKAPGQILEGAPPGQVPPQDLSGHPLQRAPTWSGSLGLQYQTALWRDLGARAGVDAAYRSAEFLNANEDPLGARPSSMRINASLRLGPPGDAWSLDFFGRNLTNRVLAYRSSDVPLFAGSHACRIDPPRLVGATLAFAF